MKMSFALWLAAFLVLVVSQAASAGATNNFTVHVAANRPWTRTGIVIEEGAFIRFTAIGTIDAAQGDPRSYYHNVPATGRAPSPQFPCPKLPGLCLMGRAGRLAPFAISPNLGFEALGKVAGQELLLGVNDDDCSDNRGEWLVRVSVTSSKDDTSESLAVPAAPRVRQRMSPGSSRSGGPLVLPVAGPGGIIEEEEAPPEASTEDSGNELPQGRSERDISLDPNDFGGRPRDVELGDPLPPGAPEIELENEVPMILEEETP